MAHIDLTTLTITKARELLEKGEVTSVELVDAYLAQITKENPEVNAYLEVFADAREQAEKQGKNPAGVLAGIPMAMKDNILIEGKHAGSASKILEGYVASYDATVTKRLRDAGTIFLGRTNMDEFAMGGSNENSAYGPVKNPHDHSRVSGGSSGGSAAAVAMNGALAALGSDTGGSVREPSSFCGTVGLKPTYGRVSRHGLMAMGSSLDQVGPVTKSVADSELLFSVISGQDPMDSTTLELPPYDIIAGQKAALAKKKLTIGVPRKLLEKGIDPDVLKNFEECLARFRSLGYDIRDIELPNSDYALAVYYILMPAEASSNLARFDGVKYGLRREGGSMVQDVFETRTAGFGTEVRRRILLGNYILSAGYYDAYYNKANTVRALIRADFEAAWNNVDLVLTPTAPMPAWKIGEKSHDPLQMYLADIFTITANLTGMPAISVPSGVTERSGKSLPLGIQLTAPHLREDLLFRAGKEFLGER